MEPGRHLGPDRRLPDDAAQHGRLHVAVALDEADDRQGAGLRRRRGQRHRPVLRPDRDGRRRPDRVHAHPGLGVPDHRHVGISGGCRASQGDAAHRRHDRRPHGCRLGPRARGGGGGRARRPRRAARRSHRRRAGQPAGDAEADGQPGVRQHGSRQYADPGDAVRRHHPALARGPLVQAVRRGAGVPRRGRLPGLWCRDPRLWRSDPGAAGSRRPVEFPPQNVVWERSRPDRGGFQTSNQMCIWPVPMEFS
ncbi:hypothetical protein BH20ACT4_BH20ACT4_01430 [soil metagenome]